MSGVDFGSDTCREIQAEFRVAQGRSVNGEMRSVKKVDNWEEKPYLRLKLDESKVDVVSDEVRETGDAANESGSLKIICEHKKESNKLSDQDQFTS